MADSLKLCVHTCTYVRFSVQMLNKLELLSYMTVRVHLASSKTTMEPLYF